ncbi:hypothetical protein EST38_g13902, partial [Candolleomyces aberdarensis]
MVKKTVLDVSAASGFSTTPCVFVVMTQKIEQTNGEESFLYQEEAFWKNLGYRCAPWEEEGKTEIAMQLKLFLDWAVGRSVGDINKALKTFGNACPFLEIASGAVAAHKFYRGKFQGLLNHTADNALYHRHVHPSQLMARRKGDKQNEFPPVMEHLQPHLDTLAADVLCELVLNEDNVIDRDSLLWPFVRRFFVQVADRLRKTRGRAMEKLHKMFMNAQKEAEELNAMPEITFGKLNAFLRSLRNLEAVTFWAPHTRAWMVAQWEGIRSLLNANSFELEGKELPHIVGVIDKVNEVKARYKGKRIMRQDLANEEEVRQTMQLFDDYVKTCEDTRVDTSHALAEMTELFDNADMGVKKYSKTTTEALCNLLDFKDERPINWNSHRSPHVAVNPWKAPDEFAEDKLTAGGPDAPRPLQMLWHQLVGVACMTELMFVDSKKFVPGFILADGTGLGKTGQTFGVISLVQQVRSCEIAGTRRPPIVANSTFFGGMGPVPDLSHLYVVPNSLIEQYRQEIMAFFKPHTVDILVIPHDPDAATKLFEDIANRPSPKINRIFIMGHASLLRHTSTAFITKRERGRPLDTDLPESRNVRQTVFSESWCTVWIDEGHEFRGPSTGFQGAVALRKRTRIMAVMTATPIWTQPRDIFQLCRIIGISQFCGSEGQTWERSETKKLQALRKEANGTQNQADVIATYEANIGSACTDQVMTEGQQAVSVGLALLIKSVQKVIGPRIIRRSAKSKGPDGETRIMFMLQDVVYHTFNVNLTDEESNILKRLVESSIKNVEGSLGPDFTWTAFWTPYRTKTVCPKSKAYDGQTTKLAATSLDWPRFKDKEDFEARAGSKLKALMKLLEHLLSSDSAPHPADDSHDDDKGTVIPVLPPGDDAPTRLRKILIYHEFAMQDRMYETAIKAHGQLPFVVNGTVAASQRDRLIRDFINSSVENRRVLLFSSIGSVGLNLACADVVIVADVLWSDVALQQIVGRAHRLGQSRTVHVYNMIALRTTDVLMRPGATRKSDMLEQLLTNGSYQDLRKFIGEEAFVGVDAGSDSEDEQDHPTIEDKDDEVAGEKNEGEKGNQSGKEDGEEHEGEKADEGGKEKGGKGVGAGEDDAGTDQEKTMGDKDEGSAPEDPPPPPKSKKGKQRATPAPKKVVKPAAKTARASASKPRATRSRARKAIKSAKIVEDPESEEAMEVDPPAGPSGLQAPRVQTADHDDHDSIRSISPLSDLEKEEIEDYLDEGQTFGKRQRGPASPKQAKKSAKTRKGSNAKAGKSGPPPVPDVLLGDTVERAPRPIRNKRPAAEDSSDEDEAAPVLKKPKAKKVKANLPDLSISYLVLAILAMSNRDGMALFTDLELWKLHGFNDIAWKKGACEATREDAILITSFMEWLALRAKGGNQELLHAVYATDVYAGVMVEERTKALAWHPAQIMAMSDKPDEWPAFSHYVSMGLVELSPQVFGLGVMDRMGENVEVRLNAEHEIRLVTINKVLRQFKLLSPYAAWYPSTQKWIAGELAGLAALMNAAGMEVGVQNNIPDVLDVVKEIAEKTKSYQSRRIHKASVANEEEVRKAMLLFEDFFRDEERVEFEGRDSSLVEAFEGGGDLGVGLYSSWSEEDLRRILEFVSGRPVNWSAVRCTNPQISSWDPRYSADFDNALQGKPTVCDAEFKELRLLWHQLVGLASMIDICFTPNATDVPGFVLADAVGVGKTAQMLALIAFLQLVHQAQQKKQRLPPII